MSRSRATITAESMKTTYSGHCNISSSRIKPTLSILPPALDGINLQDRTQFTRHVYPTFRYSKGVIDYFLSHIVFPKEIMEFPEKLSASGWDIGEVKEHPTTGFSGTNDSSQVLPLGVTQMDLEAQNHTNALVLENLLKPENSVHLMPPRRAEDGSVAETLIDIITKMELPTRVILDVGAQILELNNREVAGRSPFLSQLDVCLVFLDEAHTRGIDLKLPSNYRAAVTLGANLTKDRLVQACMRMRMLGEGQSVVFCVPEEIQAKIRALKSETRRLSGLDVSMLDILSWTIGETWRDMHRNMALWAAQGRRSELHKKIWEEARAHGEVEPGQIQEINFGEDLARRYLEEEAQTLEFRYRPRINQSLKRSGQLIGTDPIALRCSEFNDLSLDGSAALQEEEE
ncbi:hypothetical protein Hte_008315 [Hypoxylon texense]